MKKVRFNNYQKLAMVSGPLALMLNPLTVQVFLEYILWVFTGISMVCGAYFCGFLLYRGFKVDAVKIPKKAKKTTPVFIDE
jgi:hypothetical protein